MYTVNKKELVRVLEFIEKKAEPVYQKALKENMNREQMFNMANKAFELENQINALLDQVDKLQSEKDQHTAKLLAAVEKIKGQSVKIGNILLMVHETITKNPRKVTPQYKKILQGVLDVYLIDKKFINRLFKKYQTITKGSTHVSKELEMQREAKVRKLIKFVESKTGKKIQLKEGQIIDWIKEKASGLVSFFESWANAISGKVAALEQEAQAAGITPRDRGGFGVSRQMGEGKVSKKKEVKESDSFFPAKPAISPVGIKSKVIVQPDQLHEEDEAEEKEELKEAINQPDYTYYTCEVNPTGVTINEGWVDKEDALARIKEQKAEGHTAGLTFKVFSGKYLQSKSIDPSDDKNWGNPSYMKNESATTDKNRMMTGRNRVMESRPDEIETTVGRHKIVDADDPSKGNGYIAFYNGKQIPIYANSSYEAQKKAAIELKVPEKKRYMISVVLAEKDGDQVTHTFTESAKELENVDAELKETMTEGKYPWDDCMEDQEKEYGNKKTAEKVCGSIKAKNESKDFSKEVGKQIGKTKSGKPVYSGYSATHPKYKGFTKEDHKDASILHNKNGDKRYADYHMT